jgi:hypothetical protein
VEPRIRSGKNKMEELLETKLTINFGNVFGSVSGTIQDDDSDYRKM